MFGKVLATMSNAGKNAVATAKIVGVKHGPTIMIAAGVASLFTGTVMACLKSRKLDELIEDDLDEFQEEKARLIAQKTRVINQGKYSEEQAEKAYAHDLRVTYVQTAIKIGGKVVRHYAVPMIFWGIGVAFIAKGTSMLLERIANLSSAYLALKAEHDAADQKKLIEAKGVTDEDTDISAVEPGDVNGFDFVWGSGMEGFIDDDRMSNESVFANNVAWFNQQIQYSRSYNGINDFYSLFGVKPVIQFMNMVYPFTSGDPSPLVATLQQIPNSIDIGKGKTAPDYYVHLDRLPVPAETLTTIFTRDKDRKLGGAK